MKKVITFCIMLILMILFNISELYSKSYYGEGYRKYKCYISIERNPEYKTTRYRLIDSNGNDIESKNVNKQTYESIWIDDHYSYKKLSLNKKLKTCLEEAGKNLDLVEISGNWLFYGEGTEGFDIKTVKCNILNRN